MITVFVNFGRERLNAAIIMVPNIIGIFLDSLKYVVIATVKI